MKIGRVAPALLASLLLSAGLLTADDQRKGFIVGAGLGAGSVTYLSDWAWELWRWRESGVAANFKIGYAPSNSLEIFVMSGGMFFPREGSKDTLGIVGGGLAKYVKPEGTGLFFTGGIGLSVLNRSSWEGYSLETGFGFLAGLGYEPVKHLSVQADFFSAILFAGHERASGWRVTLNYLFY